MENLRYCDGLTTSLNRWDTPIGSLSLFEWRSQIGKQEELTGFVTAENRSAIALAFEIVKRLGNNTTLEQI